MHEHKDLSLDSKHPKKLSVALNAYNSSIGREIQDSRSPQTSQSSKLDLVPKNKVESTIQNAENK